MQIIVSNDASKDNSENVIKNWFENNKNVFDEFIYRANESNEGTCANYLHALELAKGDYIKAIGADDMFPVDSIYSIFRKLDEYDLVYGNPLIYAEGDDIAALEKQYQKDVIINQEEAKIPYKYRIHRYCFLNGPATYIKKDLLKNPRVIEKLAEYKYIDDYTQWLTYAEIQEINSLYIDDITIIYRRTQKSAYITKAESLKQEIERIYSYACKTAFRFRDRIICANNMFVLKHNHKALVKYFSILAWLHKWYIVKAKKKKNEMQYEKLYQNYEYIKQLLEKQE